MRRLSGGKPAGFKLCVGHKWEFLAICKAMLQTGIYPDFIVVDGNEGGTGAAPLEFMDHLGMPMREGVNFVHNALIGINARDRIKIGASGKIATAFDIARAMALGADWCNSARGFMFALGCIQSLSCHTDRCPTGVTTQDPSRNRALVVPHKTERVYNYHHATLHALAELIAAAGLDHPQDIRPIHFSQRVSTHRGEVVGATLSLAAAGRTDRRHRRRPLQGRLGDGARGVVLAGGVKLESCPGRDAARSAASQSRGPYHSTEHRDGPGSAERHEECRAAPGTRVQNSPWNRPENTDTGPRSAL